MTAGDATETTETPEHSGRTAHRAWSAGVSSTMWVFAFLILRIFAVSGYSWDTAFLVSTTISLNDGLAILFGSLMAGHLLVALLLVFVLPLLVAALLWGPRDRRLVMGLAATVSLVILVTITASFHSWWLPVAASAVLVSFSLIRRLPPDHRLRRVWFAVVVRASAVAGAAVLVLAAFLQTPWVPHEVIGTTDGTITGYVLSVDSGYLNVLTDDHVFVILLSSDVTSRK
ncbi:hypothetical protein [Tessaracoccus antarcticus]|nr:hypothetical protein [Tessaracoccus antarcticus]